MGRNLINLCGEKFNRLVVLEYLGRKRHSSYWLCRCDCGATIKVSAGALKTGGTKSCGCYRKNRMSGLTLSHGERGGENRIHTSPEYRAWGGMKERCYNKKSRDYKYYGGVGIFVCDEWINSFEAFLGDMGRKPDSSYSIDRIDSAGPYSPQNCRWATWKQQARNRKNNTGLCGYKTISEFAEKHSRVPYHNFKTRISRGWSLRDAASRPIKLRK